MNVFTIVGNTCNYPREAYRPSDLTGEQHLALQRELEKAAAYDGLDPDAAEEASHAVYFHWFTRNYAKANIGRGGARPGILCRPALRSPLGLEGVHRPTSPTCREGKGGGHRSTGASEGA